MPLLNMQVVKKMKKAELVELVKSMEVDVLTELRLKNDILNDFLCAYDRKIENDFFEWEKSECH